MEPGPYDNVQPGTALVTLVEPHRGHEVAYNRWYERDHFYAGCLIGKGWFAGRRWVATRAQKDLRFPVPSPFLPDVDVAEVGSYLAVYWIHRGEDAEAIAWGSEQVRWLHDNGRMFPERDHVHTAMYVHRWSVTRDPDGVPVALALDHPFRSLTLLTVDRDEGTDARTFGSRLRDDILPGTLAATPVALVAGLTPIPLPPDAPVTQPANPHQDRRMLLVAFGDEGPEACVATARAVAEAVAATGQGSVSFAAPFLPTIPGTDTYTDQLW